MLQLYRPAKQLVYFHFLFIALLVLPSDSRLCVCHLFKRCALSRSRFRFHFFLFRPVIWPWENLLEKKRNRATKKYFPRWRIAPEFLEAPKSFEENSRVKISHAREYRRKKSARGNSSFYRRVDWKIVFSIHLTIFHLKLLHKIRKTLFFLFLELYELKSLPETIVKNMDLKRKCDY